MVVHIFTGHRGSGKTEIAVNFAIRLTQDSPQSERRSPVALLDVDVVNPYFAAREARTVLESHGITVAAPSMSATTADLPILSGDISRALCNHEACAAIIDVGGDPVGARILRTLRQYLNGHVLSAYGVVNAKRPSTSTYAGILEYLDALAAASEIPITGLIHNTHLLHETSVEDILEGQRLLQQVSAATKLPIVFTTVMKRLAPMLPALDNDVFALDQYIKPPYA